MKIAAPANVRQAVIEAKIIRKDGRVEDLGTVAYYHPNPLRRWFFKLMRATRG